VTEGGDQAEQPLVAPLGRRPDEAGNHGRGRGTWQPSKKSFVLGRHPQASALTERRRRRRKRRQPAQPPPGAAVFGDACDTPLVGTMAGATPKANVREAAGPCRRHLGVRRRATRPSSPSNSMATKIAMPARSKFLSIAATIA
jgi:hypothetical protein